VALGEPRPAIHHISQSAAALRADNSLPANHYIFQPAAHLIDCSVNYNFSQLTLPHDLHPPSFTFELTDVTCVSGYILAKLLQPKITASSRCICVLTPLVAMPKTTMNKNHSSILRQHQIGLPRQISDMESVPKSKRMQSPTQSHFGLRVLPTYPGHYSRSGACVYNIGHDAMSLTSGHLSEQLKWTNTTER
jgi:hypothetical protein